MKKEMFLIRIITKENEKFEDLANFEETPQDAARRIFEENSKRKANRVVSIQCNERVLISNFPKNITCNWPKGAMTIPVFRFEVE